MAKKNRAQILGEFPMLRELGEKTLEKKPDKALAKIENVIYD